MTRFDASLAAPMLMRAVDEAVDALRLRRLRPANDFARFRKDLRIGDEDMERPGVAGAEVVAVDVGEERTEICGVLRRDDAEGEWGMEREAGDDQKNVGCRNSG